MISPLAELVCPQFKDINVFNDLKVLGAINLFGSGGGDYCFTTFLLITKSVVLTLTV